MNEYRFSTADLLKYFNTEQEVLEEPPYKITPFNYFKGNERCLIVHNSEVEVMGYDKETDTFLGKEGVIDVDDIFLVIPETHFVDGNPDMLVVPKDDNENYSNLWAYHVTPTFLPGEIENISDLETFYTKPDTERPTVELLINKFNKTPERAKELMELHNWLFTSNSIRVNAFFDKEVQKDHKEFIMIDNVNWLTETVKLQGIDTTITIDALLDYSLVK